jgi:hypothetical protein
MNILDEKKVMAVMGIGCGYGKTVPNEFELLNISRASFHGEWNYSITKQETHINNYSSYSAVFRLMCLPLKKIP